LIRAAAGPSHQLVLDIYKRMPGRGANVCATPGCVLAGLERGAFSRALKQPVEGDARALCDAAAGALEESAVQRLGIGRRNGSTRVGFDEVERRVRAQEVKLLVLAVDAAERTARNARQVAGFVGTPVALGPSMAVLGAAMGRGDLAVLGVTEPAAAADVAWRLQAAARLRQPLPDKGSKATKSATVVESGVTDA